MFSTDKQVVLKHLFDSIVSQNESDLALYLETYQVNEDIINTPFKVKGKYPWNTVELSYTEMTEGRYELLLNRALCVPYSESSSLIISLLLRYGADSTRTITAQSCGLTNISKYQWCAQQVKQFLFFTIPLTVSRLP